MYLLRKISRQQLKESNLMRKEANQCESWFSDAEKCTLILQFEISLSLNCLLRK